MFDHGTDRTFVISGRSLQNLRICGGKKAADKRIGSGSAIVEVAESWFVLTDEVADRIRNVAAVIVHDQLLRLLRPVWYKRCR